LRTVSTKASGWDSWTSCPAERVTRVQGAVRHGSGDVDQQVLRDVTGRASADEQGRRRDLGQVLPPPQGRVVDLIDNGGYDDPVERELSCRAGRHGSLTGKRRRCVLHHQSGDAAGLGLRDQVGDGAAHRVPDQDEIL